MAHRPTPHGDRPDAGRYEIRVAGQLDVHWTRWFDGLAVTHPGDGTTLISGPVGDQAALHGILQRIRDLGLPLLSVARIEGNPPDHPVRRTPK